MFRKVSLFILLCIATAASAQNKNNTTAKSTEKKDEPQIDYKEIGAPMAPLRMMLYKDTSKNKNSAATPANEEKSSSKKRRRRHNDSEAPTGEFSGVLTNKDVDNGANLFIMLFNPTCSHCEDETALIERNIGFIKNSKFLFLATPVMKPYLPDFVNMMHITDFPEFRIGIDSSGYLNNMFLYQALPQINIYDHDRKLLRIFTGEVAIDTLKKYIE